MTIYKTPKHTPNFILIYCNGMPIQSFIIGFYQADATMCVSYFYNVSLSNFTN